MTPMARECMAKAASKEAAFFVRVTVAGGRLTVL